MKVRIINGPNLNMLGIREPGIYGTQNYNDLVEFLKQTAGNLGFETDVFQSNSEGAIIDKIHQTFFEKYDGLIINAGAYTHYSYAIADALAILKCPIYEVHLSDIYAREDFRQFSVIKNVCTDQICGHGFDSYKMALEALKTALDKS